MKINACSAPAAIAALRELGAEGNRFEIHGQRIVVWGESNCRECKQPMVGPNWPLEITCYGVDWWKIMEPTEKVAGNLPQLEESLDDCCEQCCRGDE